MVAEVLLLHRWRVYDLSWTPYLSFMLIIGRKINKIVVPRRPVELCFSIIIGKLVGVHISLQDLVRRSVVL